MMAVAQNMSTICPGIKLASVCVCSRTHGVQKSTFFKQSEDLFWELTTF